MFLSNFAITLPAFMISSRSTPRLNGRKALEIQKPTNQQSFLPNILKRSAEESPKTMFLFGFAPQLFDFLARPLAQLVSQPALAHPHSSMRLRRPKDVTGNMRLNSPTEHRLDKLSFEKSLVRSDRLSLELEFSFGPIHQSHNPFPFCRRSLRLFDAYTDKNPVAILHDPVERVGWYRRLFGRLRRQSAIRIAFAPSNPSSDYQDLYPKTYLWAWGCLVSPSYILWAIDKLRSAQSSYSWHRL